MRTALVTWALGLPMLILFGAPSRAAQAEPLAWENEVARLVIGSDGHLAALVEKGSGRSFLGPQPVRLAWVRRAGRVYPATAVRRRGDRLHLEFADSGISAVYRIEVRPRYFVFELAALENGDVEEICLLQVAPAPTTHRGGWLNVQWDDAQAVCLLGLSDRVCTGGMRALLYPEFGLTGQKAALLAVPTRDLMDTVRQVELDQGLPSPTIGGRWAKRSPDVRRGYLFIDLTENNVDEVIRYARLGAFAYVMTYSGTWSASLGSYPIHTRNFPHGEEGLRVTVQRCHAAGLKVGLHMLTSFVAKHDPLVRPKPDPRLLKDAETALAADIDAQASEIRAEGPLDAFPSEPAYYGSARQGMTVVIDDEIVRYRGIGGPDGRTFLGCVRGYAGTRAAPHKAGARIAHLAERYGCYLADLRTSLKDQIADRIAGIINRCGFDMIYFDGGECNAANGPYWYWVGQQQMAIYRRVRRDLLVQGSGVTPWTWHIFARGCCDDFAAVAPKPYLDYHKIADSWRTYTDNFMPAELGWWGFLAWEPHHPATRSDEVEFYAARMVALDTPVSLETHLSALQANGRTEEMLRLLGDWERLRLAGTVPEEVRRRLRQGEWHLERNPEGFRLRPVRYEERRLTAPAETTVVNPFGRQPLRFRLEALPRLAPPGDPANRVLLEAARPVPLAPPPPGAPMPGALAARVDFTRPAEHRFRGLAAEAQPVAPAARTPPTPIDLLRHRALAVTFEVDGPPPGPADRPPVLNVQLEATGLRLRDHYIDLDFRGRRTVVLPEPTTERMLPEFRPAHANYPFKAAMYGFDYRQITALNLRWMRWPKNGPVRCRLVRVEALAESEAPVARPDLALRSDRLTVPVDLGTNGYAECWDGATVRVFDRNGRPRGGPFSLPVQSGAAAAVLEPGENRLRLEGPEGAAVRLTVILLGEPIWSGPAPPDPNAASP